MLIITALFGLGIVLVQGISVVEAKDPDYPTRSITFYIHRPPGSSTDLIGRLLVEKAGNYLGQQFIPVNQPAGAGANAALAVMNAKPDGYTLGLCTASLTNYLPHSATSPYKDLSGFTFIGKFVNITYCVFARTDAPFKTWKEFIEWARKNPRAAKLGTYGGKSQSAAAIVMWEVEQKEKVEFTYVPFKGGAESFFALLGGHTTLDFNVRTPQNNQYVTQGKLRILAFLSEKKSPGLEHIPSVYELYGIKLPTTMGIWGPKGLPDYILKKLEDAVFNAVRDPDFVKTAKQFEMIISPTNSVDFTKESNEDFLKVGESMKQILAEEAKKK